MDIRSYTATQNYTSLKDATKPAAQVEDAVKFVGQAADDFAAVLKQSEQRSMEAMSGNADPHSLVHALAQTELAVETAVNIRNKVVEAYQEILRMPV